jgi:hypothetical protein
MATAYPTVGELCWRKASSSANNGECVEVAAPPREIAVRDSKNPDGHILWYSAASWQSFLSQVRQGSFGYPG